MRQTAAATFRGGRSRFFNMARSWTGIGLGLGGSPLLRRGCHINHERNPSTDQLKDVEGETSEPEESEPEESGHDSGEGGEYATREPRQVFQVILG